MAYVAPAQATSVEGLQIDNSGVAAQQLVPNPTIQAGRELCFAGQTGNTSGGNQANQAVGTFSIPAGTVNGATLVVPNTLVGAGTFVFTMLTGNGGTISEVAVNPAAHAPGTSFTATIYTSGPTTGAIDCWYWLVN